MKMAAKLATGTAMNEDVTVLLQGGVVKNQVRHFLPDAKQHWEQHWRDSIGDGTALGKAALGERHWGQTTVYPVPMGTTCKLTNTFMPSPLLSKLETVFPISRSGSAPPPRSPSR
jgi:hypothetical protein